MKKITQKHDEVIRRGMLVTNVLISPASNCKHPLLVLEVGADGFAVCLDPDGGRPEHPAPLLQALPVTDRPPASKKEKTPNDP